MKWLVTALLVGAGCKSPPAAPDAYVDVDAPAQTGAGFGGGILDQLTFAVVGDSRPMTIDDTAGYPTSIVQTIWADVEAEHPPFAITTGDYMYASATGNQVDPQLDAYLAARASYAGIVYPAMGNHECTAATESNCGPGNSDGEPPNYTRFVARMIQPIGEQRPYFIERFAASDGSWSAKVIVVAANAWDGTQATWFSDVLGEPTTYTFVVRHEPPESTPAPGVPPTTLGLEKYPLTLLITGHVHAYEHVPGSHEIIVGNGGAPATSAVDYGYVIVARQPDGTLSVTAKSYETLAVIDQFAIAADGDAM